MALFGLRRATIVSACSGIAGATAVDVGLFRRRRAITVSACCGIAGVTVVDVALFGLRRATIVSACSGIAGVTAVDVGLFGLRRATIVSACSGIAGATVVEVALFGPRPATYRVGMLRYEIVDVFTDRPYAGNPLAVVFGADALDRGQLLAIAGEFNLSETAFVLPPAAGGSYRVRICTPRAELPFAGHPSVGTAATLVRLGRLAPGPLVQECGAGHLPVQASAGGATLTGGAPHVGPELDPGPYLHAVGLTAADLAGPAPRTAGTGIDSVHLLVRPDALARTAPELSRIRTVADTISVSAWDEASATSRARVFAGDLGVLEDPATGSAALAHGAYLVAAGLLPADGVARYTVRQGVEMGRPSTLECEVTAVAGRATSCRVTGTVVPVAAGDLHVPPR